MPGENNRKPFLLMDELKQAAPLKFLPKSHGSGEETLRSCPGSDDF